MNHVPDPPRSSPSLDRSPHPLSDKLKVVLERLLTEARRLTRAEAGTVYLREEDHLSFAVVQNDVLARRLGEEGGQEVLTLASLDLTEPSIARYVALTRATVNIQDVYDIPLDRPYMFDQRTDAASGYRTRSMLALPLRDRRGAAFGVLQLINALDDEGRVIPFDEERERLVASLLAQVAGALPAV